ncbi:MAG: hypothetical protein KAI16_00755 [Candidatus Pacebacteria bacterium]|nr:hypothetical protein [Candidatus Paceibacterota bacterium]
MKFFKKINKFSLSTTILIASIILGGFYYVIQINKQNSIEKQQQIKIERDLELQKQKGEKEKREYTDRKKKECYIIYDKERKAYKNTLNMYYYPLADVCTISYKRTVNKKDWCYSNDEQNTKEKAETYILRIMKIKDKKNLDEKEKETLDRNIFLFNLCKKGIVVKKF